MGSSLPLTLAKKPIRAIRVKGRLDHLSEEGVAPTEAQGTVAPCLIMPLTT